MEFRALPFLLLLLLLTGCTHYNYSPNLVATPFISGKNESTLSANLGGFLGTSNVDVQAAYNPWKRVTLMANFFRGYNKFEESDAFFPNQSYHIRYFEGAAGAWAPFGDERFHAGCFVGAGAGFVDNNFGGQRFSKLRYNKAFFQPTLTFKSKVRLGVGARFSYLGYGHGNIDLAIPERDLTAIMLIAQNAPFILLETGINVGINLKMVTWSLSVVRTGVSNNIDYNSYQFDQSNITTGLTVDLHRLIKRKQGKKSKAVPDFPESYNKQ